MATPPFQPLKYHLFNSVKKRFLIINPQAKLRLQVYTKLWTIVKPHSITQKDCFCHKPQSRWYYKTSNRKYISYILLDYVATISFLSLTHVHLPHLSRSHTQALLTLVTYSVRLCLFWKTDYPRKFWPCFHSSFHSRSRTNPLTRPN